MRKQQSAKPAISVPPNIDADVVVAYADEVEYQRFVNRHGAYAGLSRRPASIVYLPVGGRCDLVKGDEDVLRRNTLTNRSIWVRTSDLNDSESVFRCAIQGVKDKGGLLFDELYNSALQRRAKRLHDAFLALGLRAWHIEVEENVSKDVESLRKGKLDASVDVAAKTKTGKDISINAGSNLDVERQKTERFEQSLRQNIDVSFEKSVGIDGDIHDVEEKIAALGLLNDSVVSSVLTARKRQTKVKTTQELDFQFSGEIERKLDLAFKVAAKILFVTARMESEYHSFQKAVLNVKNSVKIHVED